MKTVPIQEIQANFRDYLKQLQGELLVITDAGRPVAAINLIVDEEELERLLLANNPQFQQVLEGADRQIQETGGIQHDDFWKLVEQR